ncbi:diacylglyceryl transferase [Thermotoga maritima MSB8]|uniref:Phosphatidylglycerol--prolipoprotein diacylglyceryl transferase n=1 Tax=Thermotoga maritima (strain ATCC 43589 / DSM 3109 / JCM 10099 / NBRC 100826 / MSB8) TaxID=243274 RepID=LGT_THEMA|nr:MULTISPECIES: prolipoprotein diacylglyceryl transferase [Thermotoga]Q9WY05.1 RecName: Full=Phosphatidylglycerol--prolipoprotein diacylglyceryl transferase [Thermotoga maritima MSB8]AAD35251.1 prolipoprotein diacylglyceryl transferase [Thermotoga maritima MSB8]AGL49082.1 Prolipoprotein diacylglyceryl transferase [Thermotoga maritima MSB8]AIY86347.1 prolipoprotein diacylglyceryl transferase [Thermotoga sp. 2812B]AKE26100.1 diacylglyceryl transferase [Thermotoga maritima]AKE27963.1 diacylglyc
MKKILAFLLIAAGSTLFFVFLFIFLSKVFSGEILLSRYIFRIGGFELRWYSTLILMGFLISYFVARKRAKNEGINLEEFDELIFYGVIAGIVGARLYYVLFNLKYYRSLWDALKIWEGGLAIHGAVIGALLTGFLYVRLKKPSFTFLQATDLFTSVLPLGQAIGRWGNFFNYEAFGVPTNLPWKMFVPEPYRPVVYKDYSFFHPTFLYESIWDLLVFFMLSVYFKRYRKRHGEVTCLYFVLYSLGRIVIERLRVDSLMIGNIKAAQLLSAVLILLGFTGFLILRSSQEPKRAF